jgi:transposase
MQVIYECCAGVEVHKKTVVACVLLTRPTGQVQERVRTFSTMTAGLGALSQWLQSSQVQRIAIESTGVYWWPVFNVLEADGHQVVLVNPQHLKAVPGRKTDVSESKWLAELLRHGLLRASFIPPAPIRQLRELMRYRKALVQERTQAANRLQKGLEHICKRLDRRAASSGVPARGDSRDACLIFLRFAVGCRKAEKSHLQPSPDTMSHHSVVVCRCAKPRVRRESGERFSNSCPWA